MRENRPYGSEGGAVELKPPFLPLCAPMKAFDLEGGSPSQAIVTGL
jgi:hypothetical protein